MKLDALFLIAVCLAHLPPCTFAQCAATTGISVSVPLKDSITTIPCERNGPVVFLWETFGELYDDEYFIYLEQNGQQIYSSGNSEIIGAASGQSQLVGAANGGTYSASFRCDLEGNPFTVVSCDAATFKYTIVDCGCPEGFIVAQECSLASLDYATDAECAAATESPKKPALDEDTNDDAESDILSRGAIVGFAVCGALILIIAVCLAAKAYYGCGRARDGTVKIQSHKEPSGTTDTSHQTMLPTRAPAALSVSPSQENEELVADEEMQHAQVVLADQADIHPVYLPHQKDQCRSVAPENRNDNLPLANAVLCSTIDGSDKV